MIKENELRINNYVLTGHDVVLKIQGNISEGNTGGYLLETLKPIPITEVWLLNLGFKDDTPDYCKNDTNSYWQGRGNYVFMGKSPEAQYFRIYRNPEREWDKKDIRGHKLGEWMFYVSENWLLSIKYIHQLQNVYFMITGEELTLNGL